MPVAKESGGNFTPAPEGTFVARCFGVISLGTQHSPNFADSFKVMIMWELPSETFQLDGKETPMVIQKEYTLSLSKKANLRRDLESWRGRAFTEDELKGFAVEKIVGQPCMVTIAHKTSGQGKLYASVSAVTKLLKGVQAGEQFHANVHYEVEHGRNKVFDSLPEWIRKKIEACEEWTNPAIDKEEPAKEADKPAIDPDDVPF